MAKNRNLHKDSNAKISLGVLDVSIKKSVFSELASQFNGEFLLKRTISNVLAILSIKIPYKKWNIELTESDTRPLKFEIELESSLKFEFVVGWEDFFEKVLKKLGKKEIEIGDPKFDNRYLIQSKYPDVVHVIFSKEVRELFLKFNIYSFSCLKNRTDEKLHLTTVVSRTVDNKEDYEDLIYLQFKILDNLKSRNMI